MKIYDANPKNNEDLETCARCGGYCCAHMGCELHPDDLIKAVIKV